MIQISLNSAVFAEAVSRLMPLVAKSSPLQAAYCMRLSYENGRLTVDATDAGAFGSISMKADFVNSDDQTYMCSFVVPAGRLADATKVLAKSGDPIVMTYDPGRGVCRMQSGTVKFNALVMGVSAWPTVDSVVSKKTFAAAVDAEKLVLAIRSAYKLVNPENPKEFLRGVNLRTEEGCIIVTGASGRAMLSVRLPAVVVPSTSPMSATIPYSYADAMCKVLRGYSGRLDVHVSQGAVGFSYDQTKVQSPVIAKQYAELSKFFKHDFENAVELKYDVLGRLFGTMGIVDSQTKADLVGGDVVVDIASGDGKFAARGTSAFAGEVYNEVEASVSGNGIEACIAYTVAAYSIDVTIAGPDTKVKFSREARGGRTPLYVDYVNGDGTSATMIIAVILK